jgi:hypothetical protein
MSRDLEQLLREADAAAGPPPEGEVNLSERVRSIARRRGRQARVAGATSAAALVLMACGYYALHPPAALPIVHHDAALAPSSTDMARTLASLDAEADARMALVERMLAAEQRQQQQQQQRMHQTRGPDPLLAVRREQDKAAYMLVYEADRLGRRADERMRAAEEYRRVLALFPETHWASVARDRLAELNGSSHAPRGRTNQEMS